MATLKNEASGVVVSVADSKVERLGHGWVSVDAESKAAAKPTGKKSN